MVELNLYYDSLNEKGKKYQNRFSLTIDDFLDFGKKIIKQVHFVGGRAIFYESPGNYSAIVG
jgi:hypothetical protein